MLGSLEMGCGSSVQLESNLQYELKLNDMVLVIPNDKQSLIDCIAALLGLQSNKLHSLICDRLQNCLDQLESLPRKLMYLKSDQTILADYRKYPYLVNFMKITLEMVSVIFQTKITVYSLNAQSILTGLIINEKAYQSQIKVGKINNYFYEIKQGPQSHSNHSLPKFDPSSSNQTFKFYQAFDIDPITKKIDSLQVDIGVVKSYGNIPLSPLLKKNMSMGEPRNPPAVQVDNTIPVPVQTKNSQFDELSQKSIVDGQDLISAQNLADSIKFNNSINLTQSLSLPKPNSQPISQPVQPIICQPPQQTSPTMIQQDPNQPTGESPNSLYYSYYSHYYQSYMLPQNQVRSDYGFPNTASVSPGKNSIRRQSSTLEINENQRYTGRLKFFDEAKNYGFIIMDQDENDIFVHCDDLQKAGISKDRVRSYKQSEGLIRFSFKVMSYFGKYKESRKAVELTILDDGLGLTTS